LHENSNTILYIQSHLKNDLVPKNFHQIIIVQNPHHTSAQPHERHPFNPVNSIPEDPPVTLYLHIRVAAVAACAGKAQAKEKKNNRQKRRYCTIGTKI
jgi:hypothetical protein